MSSLSTKLAGNVSLNNFTKAAELKKRIFFVFLILVIYRIGSYIPLPGIDPLALGELVDSQSGGLLGMFNMFTGGAVGRLSIFTLNIMPYITASIIMQLMTVISTEIGALKKEGESGRKKIAQYTRYLTVCLALFQGYGIAIGIEKMTTSYGSVVVFPGYFFRVVAMFSLVGGTLFVMWLSEQITVKGIGNGSSLIIFTGIVSGLPTAIAAFFEMGRTGALSTFVILLIIGLVFGLIFLIVLMEKAQRRILVQYPKRQVGNKVYGGESSHLPLKINTSGVIPPIFASSLLLFPATIAGFSQSMEVGGWRQFIAENFSHGKPIYIVLNILLIVFFSFFYTSIVFNPDETAENLRKNGGIVLGRRPGKNTAEYFDYILTRLTVIGATYICAVCIIPEILISKYSIPFYLGGTSLLIVVNVVIDIFSQIQTHLLTKQYEGLIKKSKLRGVK
ncbi:preprotein translocase subunit SecY [endosymbiont of Acanthamoeba sp. UWC8]|uniref:preprotein translocase subunit SecY n=1 Tax=endosymbiont of Acanthamoeba sp. UWC8 TaxID=86106 RepID=UPI0004D0C609|nr:preprotein translocase subunit SecY [endosymbiont of Acanthamoeba sp. UWC8]AIF81713.1 preprotein translocase subunit SecY [endosymbiont of Acanthamoeba sp. UWC8]